MTGKQLKNAILQLAIQGKLVPQDANDEPASVLLAKIRKEKEQLVKAGKLKKKELETTPITDEEKPFEIPESWEWCRLKSIFSMQAGKTIKAEELSSTADKTHIYACFGGNGIRGYIGKKNNEGKHCIVGRQGALCGNINIADGDFYATEHAVVVDQFNSSDVDWAFYFLTALNLNQFATATAQPGLAVSNIIETLIPLPPLSEQKRIVAKIEELMPLVEEYGVAQEKLNRLNAALPEALKKSILQQAIQGKLVPQDANDEPASVLLTKIRKEKEQLVKAGKLKKKELETTPITDEEKPFEIPESWEWCRLGEIFKINMGQSPTGNAVSTAKNGLEFHQGKIKFGSKYIDVSDFTTTQPNKIAEPLDILLCVRAPVGEVNITERKICIGRGLCGLTPMGEMPVDFWFYAMKTLIPAFNAKATGSTFVAISNDIIVNQIVPLPPLSEQRRIVARVEELLSMVEGMK